MLDLNPVFIPGPTNMPDRLRRAMNVQTQDHRAPDFIDTFAPVLSDTKKIFGTQEGEVIMFPSSLATIEMAMADLNYPIELGAGVAAAQEYYRNTVKL